MVHLAQIWDAESVPQTAAIMGIKDTLVQLWEPLLRGRKPRFTIVVVSIPYVR